MLDAPDARPRTRVTHWVSWAGWWGAWRGGTGRYPRADVDDKEPRSGARSCRPHAARPTTAPAPPAPQMSSHIVKAHLAADPPAVARVILARTGADAPSASADAAASVKLAARAVHKSGQKLLQACFCDIYETPTAR